MTKKRGKPKVDLESNRKHHLTGWRNYYDEKGYKFAALYLQAQETIKELKELERVCKNIDQNRRENAVHMSVSIYESDKVYNFDDIIQGVPKIVEAMKNIFSKFEDKP